VGERRRMTCLKCPRYEREALHCREGKANPRSKADTVAVAELLGLQALCHYNPYRDALALQMYFPNADITRRATAKPRSRTRRGGKITVEIEESTE
jgi:hypothetical protein